MKKLLITLLAALCLTGCSSAPKAESSEAPSYDDEPVLAVFDDAGTPDDIYDDEIVGLVYNSDIARAHE